jgi:hypothetical protein
MWTGARQQPTRMSKTSPIPGPDAGAVREADAGVSVLALRFVLCAVSQFESAFMIPPFDVRSCRVL